MLWECVQYYWQEVNKENEDVEILQRTVTFLRESERFNFDNFSSNWDAKSPCFDSRIVGKIESFFILEQ